MGIPHIIIKWLIPVLLVLSGFVIRKHLIPYRFTGLILTATAFLILCYGLIDLLGNSLIATILCWAITAMICVGIAVVAVTILVILRSARGDKPDNCDYVVVLGAGLLVDKPSRILMARINKAIHYLNENSQVVCIVSGGQGKDEAISEAQCMFDHLVAAGIDPSRIWLEDKSTSTWENFRFTQNLIQSKIGTTPNRLAVISSEFHLYRAGIFAQRCGIQAVKIPAATPGIFLKINYYLREAAGVWHYLILGGQYHD